MQTTQPRTRNKSGSVITMEEGGHVAVTLLAFVNNRPNDVSSHIGRNHTYEYQFVAIIVPKRRVSVIVEAVIHYFATDISIFMIHIATQSRPFKSMEESRIKQSLFTFRATCNLNLGEECFPSRIGFFCHLCKTFVQHFGLQIHLSILYTHKRETSLHFQRFNTFAVDKTQHSHLMFVVFYHFHLAYFIVGLSVKVDFTIAILITRERIIVNLLNLPITDIIIRTADVYQ